MSSKQTKAVISIVSYMKKKYDVAIVRLKIHCIKPLGIPNLNKPVKVNIQKAFSAPFSKHRSNNTLA